MTGIGAAANGRGACIEVAGVTARLGGVDVVHGVDLSVGDGHLLGLVGPNGSGKSTLLRCLYRALRPVAGTVRVDGADLLTMDAMTSARHTAALPQESGSVSGLNVRHIVLLGRTAHLRAWQTPSADDHELVDEALVRVDALDLAERDIGELSGGERQRVLLARALVQQPRVLVLDEPLNHLDIRHQLETLRTVRGLGITTMMAIHDLGLALRFCDRLHVLDAGRIVAAGAPRDVLTPTLTAAVFGVASRQIDLGGGAVALHCESLDDVPVTDSGGGGPSWAD